MTDRWRSMLFVPANRPDLAAKAPRSRPDVVVLDLEDAVPPDARPDARAALGDAAASILEAATHPVRVAVRVNPPATPWFDDDVEALPVAVAVVVPKLETAEEVQQVAGAVGDRPVVAGLETVRGVADAREVLRAPVVACYFGAEDFVADLGGVRSPENDEVAVPRAQVSIAARLAGIPALDMVTLDFGDEDRFDGEARQARALGYAGKLCIHPIQVALARAAFRPSPDEVAWADRVLAAFAEADGRTIAVDGQMVDEVVAVQARAVLAAVEDGD